MRAWPSSNVAPLVLKPRCKSGQTVRNQTLVLSPLSSAMGLPKTLKTLSVFKPLARHFQKSVNDVFEPGHRCGKAWRIEAASGRNKSHAAPEKKLIT